MKSQVALMFEAKMRDGFFKNDTSLTKIKIPEGVTEIGEWAFSGCTSLTSIRIPDGVTEIGAWGYCGCSSLTSIEIPSSVTKIWTGAFSYCAELQYIVVDENNTAYCSKDNVLYSKDMSILIAALGVRDSIKIPKSVTKIGAGAFSGCAYLTSIEIPDGVTDIGYMAFEGC